MKDRTVILDKPKRKYIKKKDSRWKSTSEVLTNMGISLPIHYLANFLILPPYAESIQGDFETQAIVYLHLAFWFSLVSFVRQFALRRLFNHWGPSETGYSVIIKIFKNKKII